MTDQTGQGSKTGKLFMVLVALVAVAAGLRLTGVLNPSKTSYDATVTGTVTIDGTPADRGKVSFFPADGSLVFVGMIESDGKYVAVPGRVDPADSEKGGIDAGEYAVTVQINDYLADEGLGDEDLGEWDAPRKAGKSLIASKYSSKGSSGLRFTVKPGANTFKIELVGPDEELAAEDDSTSGDTESEPTTTDQE